MDHDDSNEFTKILSFAGGNLINLHNFSRLVTKFISSELFYKMEFFIMKIKRFADNFHHKKKLFTGCLVQQVTSTSYIKVHVMSFIPITEVL